MNPKDFKLKHGNKELFDAATITGTGTSLAVILLLGGGLILCTVMSDRHIDTRLISAVGVASVLLAALAANLLYVRLLVSNDGITIRRGIFRKHIPWSEIDHVLKVPPYDRNLGIVTRNKKLIVFSYARFNNMARLINIAFSYKPASFVLPIVVTDSRRIVRKISLTIYSAIMVGFLVFFHYKRLRDHNSRFTYFSPFISDLLLSMERSSSWRR